MGVKLKNKYFILRHGETTHQIEKPGIVYYWPEDNPPASLTERGESQIKEIARKLKDKNINLIFSSDILRTRQTADIVAKELGLEVKHDKRLRDINLGIYQGKTQESFWATYKEMKERLRKAPPEGENWIEVQERMVNFIKEIEKKYQRKTILIISHGDPLWLLEGWAKGLTQEKLLDQKKRDSTIKTGELRQLP